MTLNSHPAYLDDHRLAALDVQCDFRIFPEHDDYDLAKVYDLLASAPVFGSLDVKNVTLLRDATPDGEKLTLAFTLADGHRMCTQELEPDSLIDFERDGFALEGFAQARAIVINAYDLIGATLSDLFSHFRRREGT